VKEARRKLAEEKVNLEASHCDASRAGLNEPEDLRGLSRYALVDRIAELENGLASSARQSDNVVDQLEVVNPGVELCVEGIHFLNFVEGGMMVTPHEEDGTLAYTTL